MPKILTTLLQMGYCTVRGVHPALQFSPKGQPGLKLRLTDKALDYINELAAEFLNEKLVTIKLPTITQRLSQGVVTISNAQVINVKPAKNYSLTMHEPNHITWKMEDMDMGVKSDMSGQVKVVLKVNLKGTSTIQAKGINFSITSQVGKDKKGRPKISTKSCEASVRDVSIKVKNGGVLGVLVNGLKNTVTKHFKPLLEEALCEVTKQFIDTKANERLATIPVRVPLNKEVYNITSLNQLDNLDPINENESEESEELESEEEADKTVPVSNIKAITDSLKNSLWLDYRLLKDPTIHENYLEAINNGEVSWQGKGGSPFHPPNMRHSSEESLNRMFHLYATDYIPNSMLYHAFTNKLLDITITPEDPAFGSYLKTTCFDGIFSFCVGDTLPALARDYPDRDLNLRFEALRAPAMIFNRNGEVTLDVKGVLRFYVIEPLVTDSKQQVLSLSVNMRADTNITLSPNGRIIKGQATMTRFLMAIRDSDIADLENDQLDDISSYTSDILIQLVNEQLTKGLPLPLIQGATLREPKLTVHERHIKIETDVHIDTDTIYYYALDALG